MSAEQPKAAFDRSDTRVRHDEGLGGAIRGFIDRIRSGDLGALPVVVGLAVIWTSSSTPWQGGRAFPTAALDPSPRNLGVHNC